MWLRPQPAPTALRNDSPPFQAVTKARERFHKIQEAYDVLKDPQKRARYEAGQNPTSEP